MNLKKEKKFFIDKRTTDDKRATSQQNMKSIILFSISVIYGLLIYFIITMDERGYQSFSMLALYAYGLIGGVGLLLINRFYKRVDRSRQILTEVLEKSAEARAITDPQGSTIYTNQRFDDMVPATENRNIVSFTNLFTDPVAVAEEMDKLRLKAAPAGSASGEFHTSKNGKDLWFEVTCQHIVGWEGYVHWRFDNITNRYEMEATIREEREKLRDFTDNAPVGFFSVNERGIFTFANDTLLELLESDRKNIVNKAKLHDFLVKPPNDSAPYNCFSGNNLDQQGILLFKSAKGKEFEANVTHSITKTAEDKIISRSIVHDLTSEQNMQRALKESEDKFQRLFEEAPVGICLVDKDTHIVNINQALVKVLDTKLTDIINKPLINHIHEEDTHDLQHWIKNLKQGGRKNFIEVLLQGSEPRTVQIYAHKLKEEDNLILHFIDLTERKKLEQQFTQSQKMQAVGQLAGGIAHDFNNLLTAMIGFADLLLLRHKPGDPSFNDIMQIKQNANRAANMVRQLLAFSRQQTLKPKVLDLTDVLSELSHLIRRLIGVNIDLNISHSSDQGLVKADQGQIEQVLINLAVNARDAMPEGGALDILTGTLENDKEVNLGNDETLPIGKWVTITVSDTGTGIPPEVLSRIFEPFFSTKPVGAGTGLGLATVHGIVHQTGGFLAVESTVNKGTAFTIYLPQFDNSTATIEEEEPAPEEEKQKVTDLTGSSTILLVEDEDAVRIFSSRALGNKGYIVVDAPNGEAALRLMDEKDIKPDLLITDVMMPEMDGTTLAKKVKEQYPDIKIIFISGYAEDKFKEHVGGNAYFLPKPFTLKQLAERVKEVIES